MNLQDIAAEKAKLNARAYIQSIWLNRTEPITEDTVLKWFEDIANNAWQDCLNTLAGSEGDATQLLFEHISAFTKGNEIYHPIETLQELITDYPEFKPCVNAMLEHTASAVAKAVGEKWVYTTYRLPEFDKWVLCYCKIYGFYIGSYQRILDTNAGNWNDGKDLGALPPIAWTELPTPPSK